MSKILSLAKTKYLGNTTDLRFSDGVIFSAVSANRFETGLDELHFHENPIINFILEGSSVERINSGVKPRIAGDIRFYRAGDLHQVNIKSYPSRLLGFELESEFFRWNDFSEEKINLAISKNPAAKHFFLKIYKEYLTADALTDFSIQMLFFGIISETETLLKSKKPAWTKQLYQLLNDRWNENLSLQELSATVNVHPVTISKYFTKYFGCSFGDFMRNLRINKSLSLIKNSRLSLTEISHQCGFADQSHFTRNFKNLTGFLPKDFKKL